MTLTLNPEQQLLRDNARQFISASAPLGHLRRLRDRADPTGFSRELWHEMANLGWTGIVFPEAYGGMGLGYTELGIVLEECGRSLAPTPFLSSVLLGGGALLAGGTEAQKRALVPAIARGERIVALAFEESPRFDPHRVACRAERTADGFRLSGHKSFVLDGHVADQLIVSARTSGAAGESERAGISLFLVDAQQAGLSVEATTLVDSRKAARCSLEAVEVPSSALLGALDHGADVLDPVLDRATICLSAEMLGLVSQAYETTLEYLRTRVQFDVPIGSFQALQHRAVDMFAGLELAKSVVLDALSTLDSQRSDVTTVTTTASAAKARLCDLSRSITREAIQMHGGIGMTDEHDIGLYLKRGACAELTLGDSAYHRDRYARALGF